MTVKDLNVPDAKKTPGDLKQPMKDSLVQEILEGQREATRIQSVRKAFGLEAAPVADTKPKESDNLSTAIVTHAMDSMKEHSKEQTQTIQRLEDSKKQAEDNLFKDRQQSLLNIGQKLEKAIDDLKSGVKPNKSDIETFNEVYTALKVMKGEEAPHTPVVADSRLMLELEKLKIDHDTEMARLADEREGRQRQWELEKQKWADESRMRWAEFADKKDLKHKAEEGLQDIVGAIGENIKKAKAESNGEVAATEGVDSETPADVQAEITKFPCSQCGENVPIPEGATTVTCPQCSSEYKIKGKR